MARVSVSRPVQDQEIINNPMAHDSLDNVCIMMQSKFLLLDTTIATLPHHVQLVNVDTTAQLQQLRQHASDSGELGWPKNTGSGSRP